MHVQDYYARRAPALAKLSGLSTEAISSLEQGNSSPSLESLRGLCVGLNLELSELFELFEKRD